MGDRIDPRQAQAGDTLVLEGRRIGGARRTGEIAEVLGDPERPYFRVRWADGRESTLHPGPDAAVETSRPVAAPPARRPSAAKAAKGRSRAKAEPPPFQTKDAVESSIRGAVGDRLIVRHHHLGERDRDAEILEVLGPDGQPPYRVRWSEDGHESILRPGTDVVVEHFPHGGG